MVSSRIGFPPWFSFPDIFFGIPLLALSDCRSRSEYIFPDIVDNPISAALVEMRQQEEFYLNTKNK
jgi:hypothetical protein